MKAFSLEQRTIHSASRELLICSVTRTFVHFVSLSQKLFLESNRDGIIAASHHLARLLLAAMVVVVVVILIPRLVEFFIFLRRAADCY